MNFIQLEIQMKITSKGKFFKKNKTFDDWSLKEK